MGVQQLIANNGNILIEADVTASTVAASTEITRTGTTRQGTGLAVLSGEYTGHESATYDVQIVTGEGNGRASSPKFTGVGSGTLVVTKASIPAQEVSITLVTPPFAGAKAEAKIGTDIIQAVDSGAGGNLISIIVNRGGLSATTTSNSALEDIAADEDELTSYLWNIQGVTCTTDSSGNVPEDAPRVQFGSDPVIYRIVKDIKQGKTILSPPAARPIAKGDAIKLISGTYSMTVTDGITSESYTSLITNFDAISALLGSSLVQPAYTPAPVYSAGGNSAVDLQLITDPVAYISEYSDVSIKPLSVAARTFAGADTITMQSLGNGTWSVKGGSGAVYSPAMEGYPYAPSDSPIMLTIPSRPQTGVTSTESVYISATSLAERTSSELLPVLCIEGVIGKNAISKSITATYTVRPAEDDGCACPPDSARWSASCLGVDNIQGGEGLSIDPVYKSRLQTLYEWRKNFILQNTSKSEASETTSVVRYFLSGSVHVKLGQQLSIVIPQKTFDSSGEANSYLNNFCADWTNGKLVDWYGVIGGVTYSAGSYVAAGTRKSKTGGLYATITKFSDTEGTWFDTEAEATAFMDAMLADDNVNSTDSVLEITPVWSENTVVSTVIYGAATKDIAFMTPFFDMLLDSLANIYTSAEALELWDELAAEVLADITSLMAPLYDGLYDDGQSYGTSGDDLNSGAVAAYIQRYNARVDLICLAAGIVPGKASPDGGSTGCWQDSDAGYWWVLSDGYAPAFTGLEYYSSRAGTYENTQEFGFMIKCGCEERLKAGDQITIQIGSNMSALYWSSSEFLKITTIPTLPLSFSGGKNSDDSEIWTVAGKDGSGDILPQFVADTINRGYNSGGLAFTLDAGGIPYSTGDRFTFSVEGGTFKWRKNGGAWSDSAAIANGVSIDSGLTASFMQGVSPSFVTDDLFSFQAEQKAAATGATVPNNSEWSWTASTATITFTFAEADISHLALLHSLPTGTAIAVDYSEDGTTFKSLAWASGIIRDYLHVTSGTTVTAVKLRIIADSPGAIRWIWAGVPLQPEYSASLRIRRMFDITRAKQAGSAALLGQGEGATIEWQALTPDDADGLVSLVRHCKTNGDLPLILIPQYKHPEEAIIARLADDGLELTDMFDYQPDDTAHRVLSASMELVPEWR